MCSGLSGYQLVAITALGNHLMILYDNEIGDLFINQSCGTHPAESFIRSEAMTALTVVTKSNRICWHHGCCGKNISQLMKKTKQ